MDALSAKKYYHFVRLMGRAASHITLECALQTHPQAAIICEEVHQNNRRLADIVHEVQPHCGHADLLLLLMKHSCLLRLLCSYSLRSTQIHSSKCTLLDLTHSRSVPWYQYL